MRLGALVTTAALTLVPATGWSAAQDSGLRDQAIAGMKRAATYFRTHASSHGGYVYYVSLDLKQHVGEGIATPDQIFTEPPGTPCVGLAYLEAYAATGDKDYLDAATETGHALIHGQLESGGWSQRIDFNPNGDHVGTYRDGTGRMAGAPGTKANPNTSSLDDDQTQSSIQFLARLDRALGFKDATVRDAVRYALDHLLGAQFPNGGFPQGWNHPAKSYPVIKANYPADWLRVWPHEEYYRYYTLNDGLVGTVSDTLLTAYEVYQDERYRAALAKLGDFLVLAQMPDPQPAWCQQYNFEMQPTWARKFEPPAICGFESEDAMKTLMKIYRVTADRKYLRPIPRALAYLRTCVLPDGKMARYYELKTNRPLYMTRKPGVSGNSNAPGYYDISYEDKNLPKHYGWKQEPRLDAIAKEYAALEAGAREPARVIQRFNEAGKLMAVDPTEPVAAPSAAALEPQVRQILKDLDDQGRWVTVYDGTARIVGQPRFEKGFRFLASNTFNYNVEILSEYIAATGGK
jgi:PelA/Pel-15E family pectate lyase